MCIYVCVCVFIWVSGKSVHAKYTNGGQKTALEDSQALSSIF